MNPVIRILQILLAVFTLNGLFGLGLRLAFSPLSSEGSPKLGYIAGSIIAMFTLVLIIYLLQRYYELRNNRTMTNPKLFLGRALTAASIALYAGFCVVILFVALAFAYL